MRKIYLLVASLFMVMSMGFSQNLQLIVNPEDISVDAGEQFSVDITVQNFNEILALEFFAKLVLPIVLFALAMAVSKKVGSDV